MWEPLCAVRGRGEVSRGRHLRGRDPARLIDQLTGYSQTSSVRHSREVSLQRQFQGQKAKSRALDMFESCGARVHTVCAYEKRKPFSKGLAMCPELLANPKLTVVCSHPVLGTCGGTESGDRLNSQYDSRDLPTCQLLRKRKQSSRKRLAP